jgi:hypothetical protein
MRSMASPHYAGLKVFVPFINEEMVRRFFLENPHMRDVEAHLLDNRVRAAGLPELYNEIIQRYVNEDCWLFFVHEDFEVKGPLFDLAALPKYCVYGTFGVRLDGHTPVGVGRHICSAKDGTSAQPVGVPITERTSVDTLDCQSVLLHTAMLRHYPRLRFDEELTFDLYAEDLGLNAQYNFGIPAMVVPLQFQHYSMGRVTERYWRGLRHLARKYPTVGVPGPCSFIGGRSAELEALYTYDIPANPVAERLTTKA